MRKSKYTEEQMVTAIKQVELGIPIADVCRKYGVSQQTLYRWRSKYGCHRSLQNRPLMVT